MVARRCRIQARPNVAVGAKKSKPLLSRLESADKAHVSAQGDAVETEDENAETVLEKQTMQQQQQRETITADQTVENTKTAAANVSVIDEHMTTPPGSPRISSSCKSSRPQSPLKSPINVGGSGILPVDEQLFPKRQRCMSSVSSQMSPTKSDFPSKLRKKFTGDEPLNPKTMTMQDLIFWNPKNAKRLHEEQKKKRKDSVTDSENLEKGTEKEQKKPTCAAPQVRITEDGSLVIDESSLTIMNESESAVWETVEEDRVNKKLNSMSFRKRPFCRGNPWSELETDLFYDILRATGPDFGLMHEFFPSRSRLELKAKYNREERTNWTRLNQALAVPTLLSDALYSHANEVIDRVKKEEMKKKLKSLKKNDIFSSDTNNELSAVDWKESEADLEAEAEEAILRLLKEDKEQPSEKKSCKKKKINRKEMKNDLLAEVAEEAAMVVKEKKYEKRKNEWRMMIEKALSKLDEDFPSFEILIDDNAKSVTVETNSCSEGSPVVRIPPGTVAKVLPADRTHPQRVFFECFAIGDHTVRQYVIQHQMSAGGPSTGFLHLFGTTAS